MEDLSTVRSPRRELQLQGQRPAPLKVSKDSHKIRKPPTAPQQHPQPPQTHPFRPPVIIYTVSPKVIHTNPSEFMALVQRLTGPSPTSSSSSFFQGNSTCGAISPAARFASIEKTKSQEGKKPLSSRDDTETAIIEGIEISTEVERKGLFQGILSPNPASLPTISPSFFSPPSDPNLLSFFHDLSPVLQGSKNYVDVNFMPSPSNFLSPSITSPTPSLDIFNNFLDF